MRLKWIFEILSHVETKGAHLKSSDTTSPITTNISNINKIKFFISQIESIPLFRNPIEQLKLTDLYSSQDDSLVVRREVSSDIFRFHNWIFTSVHALLQNLNEVYPATTEYTITIKLPEPKDLEDMIQILEVVHTALSQNLHNAKIKGEVKIESWETGSFWIDIFVGSQAAVLLVGSLAWAATVVYKKLQEGRMFAEYVKGLKVKNDSLEDLRIGQKEAIKLLIEREALNVLVEHFGSENDPEQFERLKMGIRTMAELIERGAEIHPSLNAPENVRNLFPNMNQLETLQTRIKLLDAYSSDGEKDHPTTT
jgi:hypothetical protein